MVKIIVWILAIALLGGGMYARVYNDQQADKLAAKLAKADTDGADTAAPAKALRTYVAAHMGASVSYNLPASYGRAQDAIKTVAVSQAANAKVYADAQAACSSKRDSIALAKCNQAYITAHLATPTTPAPLVTPNPADYQAVLSSPWWTPDLAGWLLLLGLLMLLGASLTLLWRRR